MSLLLGDLRAAVVEAGASEDLAKKAATEAATYESMLATIETKLSVLTWMVGATVGLTLLALGSLGAIWFRLADLSSSMARLVH